LGTKFVYSSIDFSTKLYGRFLIDASLSDTPPPHRRSAWRASVVGVANAEL
jgi:hypothetical protein